MLKSYETRFSYLGAVEGRPETRVWDKEDDFPHAEYLYYLGFPVYLLSFKRLEEKGLVVRYLGRKGKRPEKYIYKITPQGEDAFERLLSENILTFERPIFNVDLSLYFLPLVKAKMARSRLRSRLRGMKRIIRWLWEKKSQLTREGQSYYLQAILAHQIALTEADINFTQGLIEHLASQEGKP